MKWEVTIKHTDNGYIVAYRSDQTNQRVYEMPDKEDDTNRDHVIAMLYDILEFFDEQGSKHDKRRIHLGYVEGSGYLGKENPARGVGFPLLEEKRKNG